MDPGASGNWSVSREGRGRVGRSGDERGRARGRADSRQLRLADRPGVCWSRAQGDWIVARGWRWARSPGLALRYFADCVNNIRGGRGVAMPDRPEAISGPQRSGRTNRGLPDLAPLDTTAWRVK